MKRVLSLLFMASVFFHCAEDPAPVSEPAETDVAEMPLQAPLSATDASEEISAVSPMASNEITGEAASPDSLGTSFGMDAPRVGQIGSPGAMRYDMLADPTTRAALIRDQQEVTAHPPETLVARVIYIDGTPATNQTFTFLHDGRASEEITTNAEGYFPLPLHRDESSSAEFDINAGDRWGDAMAEVMGGLVVYRLPHTLGTLHGRLMEGERTNTPVPNKEAVLVAERLSNAVRGLHFNYGWRTPNLSIPAMKLEIPISSDELGLFDVEDFPIPDGESRLTGSPGQRMWVRPPGPMAWETPELGDRNRRNNMGLDRGDLSDPHRIHDFILPSLTDFQGIIINAETEEPMLEFSFWIARGYSSADSAIELVTDEEGRFLLENIPGIESRGYQSSQFEVVLRNTPYVWSPNMEVRISHNAAHQPEEGLTLSVLERDMISFQSLDPEGNPLPGVTITGVTEVRGRSSVQRVGTTDETGLLIIGRPDWEGEFIFQGQHPDWRWIYSQPTTLGETQVIFLEAIGLMDLEVEVLDPAGEHVSGANTTLQFRNPTNGRLQSFNTNAHTNSEGLANFTGAPRLPSVIAVREHNGLTAEESVDLSALNPPERVTLTLGDAEEVEVSGRVLDVLCNPVAGATVITERNRQWNGSEWIEETLQSVTTDADGRFVCTVKKESGSEQIRIQVEAENHLPASQNITPGDEAEFHLTPSFTLKGQFIGADLSGVDRFQISGRLGSRITLHEDGSFESAMAQFGRFEGPPFYPCIETPEEPTEVTLQMRVNETLYAERTISITHQPGQVIDLGVIELSEPIQMWVKVTDEHGSPLAGSMVSLQPEAMRGSETWPTGEDGLTPPIPTIPGQCILVAGVDGYRWHDEVIEVSESNILEVRLHPLEQCIVALRLRDEEGRPVEGRRVNLGMPLVEHPIGPDSFFRRDGVTDAAGRIQFDDIPYGKVSVSLLANPGNVSNAFLNGQITLGTGVDEQTSYDLEWQIPPVVPITVSVTHPSAQARYYVGIRSTLGDETNGNPQYGQNASPDENGIAQFSVPLGEVEVQMTSRAQEQWARTIQITASGEHFELD